MPDKKQSTGDADNLRRRAEEKLKKRIPADADEPRKLHELQVHQIELEMQNEELHHARSQLEILLEKFTDLYDFAPVGYFTLDVSGRILETNLYGAGLLGVERALLIRRNFVDFVIPEKQATYRNFLKAVFAGVAKSNCEVAVKNPDGTIIWVDMQGNEGLPGKDAKRYCRLIASDITSLKRAEEAQSRVEALNRANQELQLEIERRKEVEADLRSSQRKQAALLKKSRHLQDQLRELSHKVLNSQEEERRRISLELHDEIAQTLVGINVHLSALTRDTNMQGGGVLEKITNAQKLVEDSVSRVHRFAMKLRPPVLDDLGLVAALNSYLRDFTTQTKIPVDFREVPDLDKLSEDRCTILYRVVQEALTNVSRHAQASQVKITIKRGKKTLSMEIHDNGKSFDVERELQDDKEKRIGVIGMRERMEMVGGSLRIVSSPDEGTTVSASMPIGKSLSKTKKTL